MLIHRFTETLIRDHNFIIDGIRTTGNSVEISLRKVYGENKAIVVNMTQEYDFEHVSFTAKHNYFGYILMCNKNIITLGEMMVIIKSIEAVMDDWRDAIDDKED